MRTLGSAGDDLQSSKPMIANSTLLSEKLGLQSASRSPGYRALCFVIAAPTTILSPSCHLCNKVIPLLTIFVLHLAPGAETLPHLALSTALSPL